MPVEIHATKHKLYKALKQKQALQNRQRLFLYKPSAKQALFHQLGATAHERLFLAGNRCGKTWCGAMEVAMHLTGDYPSWWQGRRFNHAVKAWVASNTAESTRDILQNLYVGSKNGVPGLVPNSRIIRMTSKRGVSDAVDTVYIAHNNGGVSALGFKSYDQGREKFQGTSRHIIHLDEEPEMDLYDECLLRTLDVGGSVILTMTPLKGMSDVCLHFLTDATETVPKNGKVFVQASWSDAPHLAATDVARLRQSLRPHEVEAREKGIPALGSGRIFPVTEAEITVERFVIPPEYKRAYGLDFGWTNPTAAVFGAYDAEADVLYITDVYTATEKSPAEHAAALLQFGKWVPGVCDPAGQSASQADGVSLMEKYARHGVVLTKADNSVEAGLMEMLERMRSGRLKVFADLAPWWREFRLYRRDGRGQVVKHNDHLMDATRYLVSSGLVLARTAPNPSQKRLQRPTGWTTV